MNKIIIRRNFNAAQVEVEVIFHFIFKTLDKTK